MLEGVLMKKASVSRSFVKNIDFFSFFFPSALLVYDGLSGEYWCMKVI